MREFVSVLNLRTYQPVKSEKKKMKINPFEALFQYTRDPLHWATSHEETKLAILLGDYDDDAIKHIGKISGWTKAEVKLIKKEAAAVKEAREQWESFNQAIEKDSTT